MGCTVKRATRALNFWPTFLWMMRRRASTLKCQLIWPDLRYMRAGFYSYYYCWVLLFWGSPGLPLPLCTHFSWFAGGAHFSPLSHWMNSSSAHYLLRRFSVWCLGPHSHLGVPSLSEWMAHWMIGCPFLSVDTDTALPGDSMACVISVALSFSLFLYFFPVWCHVVDSVIFNQLHTQTVFLSGWHLAYLAWARLLPPLTCFCICMAGLSLSIPEQLLLCCVVFGLFISSPITTHCPLSLQPSGSPPRTPPLYCVDCRCTTVPHRLLS